MLSNPEIRSTFRRWGIVILLLVMIAVLVFSIILGGDWGLAFASEEVVPVSINSDLDANYQRDTFSGVIGALDMGIIEEVIYDQQPGGPDTAEKIEDIVEDLQTPVPSVTPVLTLTPMQIVTRTGTVEATNTLASNPTSTLTASNTPLGTATATLPYPSSTPIPSATGTIQPSSTTMPDATETPSITPTQTSTLLPTFTPTKTLSPTNTSTLAPTKTPTPSPSNTLVPTKIPTATPDICSLVTFDGFEVKKDEIRWTITNHSLETILITEIFLDWPGDNAQLKKVKLVKKTIWDIQDEAPPTFIYTDWKGNQKDREIMPGKTVELVFEFDNNAALIDYLLVITLNDKCVITAVE